MALRITNQVERGARITLSVNGETVSAHVGETIATVLLAEGITTFNFTRGGKPRAPYCNMGTCFECQVKVASAGSAAWRWVRGCMQPVESGMFIITGAPLQSPEDSTPEN